jgi:hypothetical protein
VYQSPESEQFRHVTSLIVEHAGLQPVTKSARPTVHRLAAPCTGPARDFGLGVDVGVRAPDGQVLPPPVAHD